MKKAELEKVLAEIKERLDELGDLSDLVASGRELPPLVKDLRQRKGVLDKTLAQLPQNENKLADLLKKTTEVKSELDKGEKTLKELIKKTDDLREKTDDLREKTLDQLGMAANEKLANSFFKVQTDLTSERDEWLKRLRSVVWLLIFTTVGIVIWQVWEGKTIYDVSFLVKIAITSPIVYALVFINREYSHTRNLINEYTLKATVARSFEAYKEILDDAYEKQTKDVLREKLGFILEKINDLYSSPMRNIKDNKITENENKSDILSRVRRIIFDEDETIPTKPTE